MSYKQDSIALLSATVKKETKNGVDFKSKRNVRLRKLLGPPTVQVYGPYRQVTELRRTYPLKKTNRKGVVGDIRRTGTLLMAVE